MNIDRDRVLQAAASIDCANEREAAVVGGIVASILTKGKFDRRFVQHHVSAACAWADDIRLQEMSSWDPDYGEVPAFANVAPIDRSMPSEQSMAPMVAKFMDAWRNPGTPAVA